MQLALLSPFIVMIFHKNYKAGIWTTVFLIVLNLALTGVFAYAYDISLDNQVFVLNDALSFLVIKPWMKLGSWAMGICSGWFYLEILKYRAATPDEKQNWKVIHSIVNKSSTSGILMFVSLALIIANLFTLSHGGQKQMYVLGHQGLLILLFLGCWDWFKDVITSPSFIFFGKCAYIVCIVHPFIILYMYYGQEEGLSITPSLMFYIAITNIFLEVIVSFFLYLLMELPYKRMVNYYLRPMISHDRYLI